MSSPVFHNAIKSLELRMADGQVFKAATTAIKEFLIDLIRDPSGTQTGRITIVFEIEDFTWSYNFPEDMDDEEYRRLLDGGGADTNRLEIDGDDPKLLP